MFQHSMLRNPLDANGLSVIRLTLLSAVFASVVFGLLAMGSLSQAEAKSTQRVELGASNVQTLAPNCGKSFVRDCIVEGKVTAFQALSAAQAGRNFVVPFHGKLVSWTISLAQPTRVDIDGNPPQLPSFNLIFGAPSQAGVSILRRVEKKKKGGPRFKLVRSSPLQTLNPYFGTKVTFALEKPLNVRKDQMVALTIPTWVPALWQPRVCNFLSDIGQVLDPDSCDRAHEQYTWRGSRVSRGEDKCALKNTKDGPNEQLAKTRPQTGIDSVRRYGCYYGGSVLLYSATIVGQ